MRRSMQPFDSADRSFGRAVPAASAYGRLSHRKRLAIELSIGLIVLSLIGLGASVQMPGWMRLIGWAFLMGGLLGQSVLVLQRWKRRRGWRR